MTPNTLVQAWDKGLPLRGQLRLTLAERVAGNPQLTELVEIRFNLLAETVSKAIDFFAPGFALTVKAQPLRGADWVFDYVMTQAATDAMALLLSGLDVVSADMGGDLFSKADVNGDPASLVPHALAMPAIAPPKLCDDAGAEIPAAMVPKLRGAEVFVSLPKSTGFDEDVMWTGLIRLAALIEEGCFDPIDVAGDERPFVEPIIGHDESGDWHQLGLNFFPGDAALGPVLLSFVARALGQMPPAVLTVQFAS